VHRPRLVMMSLTLISPSRSNPFGQVLKFCSLN
jgi:hypothetical protein